MLVPQSCRTWHEAAELPFTLFYFVDFQFLADRALRNMNAIDIKMVFVCLRQCVMLLNETPCINRV